MKKTITDTTSAAVDLELNSLRETVGSSALGRVLTLVVVKSEAAVKKALDAAYESSQAHPSRVIVILPQPGGEPRLNAELRVGSDAGASEIAILRARGGAADNLDTLVTPLLLSDTPVVVWWLDEIPADPGHSALGRIATRRITTLQRSHTNPATALRSLRATYTPGDTDLAWAATTRWRNYLAALLDEFPTRQPASARVVGEKDRGATLMLGAWLGLRLGVPVALEHEDAAGLITYAEITFADGEAVSVHRPTGNTHAMLHRPGRHDQQVGLAPRTLDAMLIEELQEMGRDHAYEDVLLHGLPAVGIS
ncbi:glucose-6-phosphate dehydrogenase assembly protein OpcA [Neoactinobaculum massilliense]|uniref:glucose-6-phosphate dehydrogenase assembly protein OpcA n=1 Tax=Neoactinobaculum massilliense TaxID=2364794 RepID=UPI000F546164|nr:glucose-6-phosphate dehydrogenase assembly protein OpcA [Neoactinobaculum massilliense]